MNVILDLYSQALANSYLLLLVLVLGFVLLVKGADWLVDGASAVAKRFGVSDLIIGLTVVAFGTSMPEFVVNMVSSSHGNTELAITNVLGSNAINIFVILGLTAVIYPVTSEKQSRDVDIPVACVGALLIFIFSCFSLPWHWSFTSDGTDYITGIGGSVLVLGFLMYMLYLTHHALGAKKHRSAFADASTLQTSSSDQESPKQSEMPLWLSAVGVVGGLLGLTMGGEMCVDAATAAAHKLGVSDAIIGLTVVALGTSLPELATSVIAATKKNADLALGNCVGSCIFNIFFVLAISSCIRPLQGYDGLWLDAFMAFLGPLLVWINVRNDDEHQVSRAEGAFLLIIYAVYLTYRLVSL